MSDPDDIIIEPFGGSGTTLIACHQLNRKCRIMELEPKYVDVIIDRWQKFTGEKAVLING
jgi:DNA modification methylase